jgi:hypothetical protein
MKTRETFNTQLIQFLVTIPACVFVIPRFGANGGIFLLLLGIAFSKLYAVSMVRTNFGFIFHIQSTIKMLVSGLISSITTHYIFAKIMINPWIEIILGGTFSFTIYLLFILFFRTLSTADFERLKRLGHELGPISKPYLIFLSLIKRVDNLV